ncbi:diaminopimelate decarboxylase [Duganella sp. 1411]|jgi:diaminopimelate decarboxylase|uniref:diaminopimelate decarboxylase n=1 Tax=Duganella sp. 1411 TaxID=2806572 RepID=UPI001AE228EC|nr:diaminopimelate decarboxylase [Duganella sp. 1411]MBP1204501.1 diaminopimelate decarboxylase [Duganella sp. 1411]
MDHFHYVNGELHIEGVPASAIAEAHGSPVYVYSAQTFKDHCSVVRSAFSGLEPLICFSVKSCSNLAVLKLLVEQGCGLDVVSGGELYRALQAGAAPEKIVFAGVGKSREELTYAIDAGVFLFNAESEGELARIDEVARAAGKRVKAAVRVNPDVADADTHEKTSTGGRQTKFGVPLLRAEALFERNLYRHVDVVGIHVHLGSPIAATATYLAAIDKVEQLADRIEASGGKIEFINIGGGFPAHYRASEAREYCSLGEMGAAICDRLQGLKRRGKHFIIEPGRSISANAGILLTSVEYVKQGWERKIAIVDAGMNVLLRPTLYGASHAIWPASFGAFDGHWSALPGLGGTNDGEGFDAIDIVGPICETGDYFALGRAMPALDGGDLLAIFSCGAYGMSMASQYNSRGRPAEVMVEKDRQRLIRHRESYADLVAHELCGL